MTNGTDASPVDDEHVNQEDILTPDVQDELLLELPIMANGATCAKNWDVSLLQNCTNERLKVIARDFESIVISNYRTKPELYKALHAAMLLDDDCDTCGDMDGGGQCNPSTHTFLPWWDAPAGWTMGPSGIFVKTTNQVPPGPTQPVTEPPPTDTAPTQPVTRSASFGIPMQPRVNVSNVLNQQLLTLPPPGSTVGNQTIRQQQPYTPAPQGPSPSNSVLRPTGSPDQHVGQSTSPIIGGITQQHAPPTDIPQILINGGAALEASMNAFAGSSTQVNPLANLQAQLDAEDAETQKRYEQEALQAQQQAAIQASQSNKLAEAQFRQQREQQRQQAAAAQQQRLQQIRAAAATPPVRMPNPTFATPAPTPVHSAPASSFMFGNPVRNPAPHQFAQGPLNPTNSPSFAQTAYAATPHTQFNTAQGYTPPPTNPGYQQPPMTPPVPPAAPAQAPAPAGFMTYEQANQWFDQRMQGLNMGGLAPGMFSPFGGSAPQLNQGKAISHGIENLDQAAALGIHARPVYEVSSDLVGVEMHKFRKFMTPGDDEIGAGLVFRKARWPHNMLQPGIPGFDVVAHKDLSYHQLMNGLLSKMLAETPATQLSPELASKIHFAQFLTAMTFHYSHKQVIETCREMIMAWQMKEFEWSNWPLIESRLKNIRARFQQSPQPHAVNSKARDPKPPHGGGGGGGSQPPKNPNHGGKNVNGVLNSYMKDNFICIKYNERDGCTEQSATHLNKWDKTSTLRHVCGGCHKKSGAELAHAAHGCNKGPFAQLFR